MKITYQVKKYLMISIITYAIIILLLTVCNVSFSIYYFSAIATTLFIMFTENGLKKEMKNREQELLSLDWLLSEIRHRFYVHGMVDEAVREAMEVCRDQKLKCIIDKMFAVLSSTDPKYKAGEFRKQVKNRYYGVLLTLSIMVMEFGDQKIDGQSLYLSNLKGLRAELHMELKEIRTIRHYFAGLTFIIIVPMLCLKLIERWGLNNLSELERYYHGNYQILFYLSLFLITIGLYYIFYLCKAPARIYAKDHLILRELSKRKWMARIYNNYEERMPGSIRRQELLLHRSGASLGVEELLTRRILQSSFVFVIIFTIGIVLYEFKWSGFCALAALIGACLAFKEPIWMMRYKSSLMQMYMEEEVLAFQSILIMLMHMDRITTYELIEVMEEFAVIFKQPLKLCLSEYESNQQRALLHLKDQISNAAMEKLIDNLMMCDEIGIEKALDELTLEKSFYTEKRKQQSEYNLEKKGVLCKFLAFIPLVVTIGLYLILPFITVSIQKLIEISQEISMGK